jgi:hypothetical protein
VVALLVGPMGLAVAVLLFGAGPISQMPIYQIYFSVLKWGLGPGLVSVYISYYLDRQTYQDLPNIDHSFRTVGWRLINCLGFATATIFVLLPSLLALQAQADPDSGWTSAKLRVVATGSMFCLAFGLALAAQFGLRKNVPHPATTLLPVPS